MSTESLASAGMALEPRPRKKLSFRDPEVMTSNGTTGNKEGISSSGTILPSIAINSLASAKDQGFSDSMENVDLEVFVVDLRLF